MLVPLPKLSPAVFLLQFGEFNELALFQSLVDFTDRADNFLLSIARPIQRGSSVAAQTTALQSPTVCAHPLRAPVACGGGDGGASC